jgi:hypothetical protein
MGSSAQREGRYKLFAGGVTYFLKIFEERGELFLGLVEDLRPKWGRFFPVLVCFQGSGLGELRTRPTRGDTSCRSLLGESDRLWGMISHAHFQARATLGARGKLGEIPLFFVTKSDGVSPVGKGGRLRRGGGRLGEPALSGGWHRGGGFILGGGWAVPDACGLGLGRTVGHGPYRVGLYRSGPYRGVGGRRASSSWVNWSR